jgi:hypothetical protein
VGVRSLTTSSATTLIPVSLPLMIALPFRHHSVTTLRIPALTIGRRKRRTLGLNIGTSQPPQPSQLHLSTRLPPPLPNMRISRSLKSLKTITMLICAAHQSTPVSEVASLGMVNAPNLSMRRARIQESVRSTTPSANSSSNPSVRIA